MRAFRLFMLVAWLASGKTRSDVPLAPSPAKVVAAQKIFIVNGGDALAYDAAYAAFKHWPRYSLLDSSSGADIIIEIRVVLTGFPTRHTVHPNASELPNPPLMLVITDPSAHEQLWSALELRRSAILPKNRDKETIDAAERLVGDLKSRIAIR